MDLDAMLTQLDQMTSTSQCVCTQMLAAHSLTSLQALGYGIAGGYEPCATHAGRSPLSLVQRGTGPSEPAERVAAG